MIEQDIARARERPRPAGVRWKFKPALIIATAVLAAIALALVFKNVWLGNAGSEPVAFAEVGATSASQDADSDGSAAGSRGSSGNAGSSSAATAVAAEDNNGSKSPGSGSSATLKVYVTGAVRTPGVYPLATDARIEDAIAAAGGFADGADPLKVNLASRVVDGQQIYVLKVGEEIPAGLGAGGASNSGGSGSGVVDGGGGAVNLNSATSEQLQDLPGIGPALAERIVQWRTDNGGFRSVDELDNVSGIGPALMGRLRDRVQI